DSRKVIIMVTDEDDRYAGISTDDFIAGLHQRVAPEMLDLYAVVATPGCPRDTYASPPDRISEVVRREGGRIFPICDESFGEHLASIGADIRRELLRKEIYLMDYPERDTLQLRYGGVPIPEGQGWHYHPDRN